MLSPSRFYTLIFLLGLAVFPAWLGARVLRIEIQSREVILQGQTFGDHGAYELLKGKIYYGFDPGNSYNANITDLKLAPRNAAGLVEAWGDLVVLQPLDPSKSNGIGLVEVSNRGGKFSPSYFNRATKGLELLPDDPAYWGDGLLMRQGLTVIWIGWQFDNPEGENILNFTPPIAHSPDGQSIYGMVRSDWTVDEATPSLGLGHRDQRGYLAVDLDAQDHQLTVRDGRDAPRVLIPRNQWRFGKISSGKFTPSNQDITLEGNFQAGQIYELVYKAQDPPIVGLGLAAIRDVVAYAKYNSSCPFSIKQGIAAGVSQTGRFLRQFLYQGFNTDETGRKAYDGMLVITAGAGRGSFNHRFAQPSRDGHRYSAFAYPTDLFPFSSQDQTDPLNGNTDGLLSHLYRPEHAPKIFYINSGYEYWGRAASLIHLSLDGAHDIAPLPNERIYHLASGQHYVDQFPPSTLLSITGAEVYRGNPLDLKVNYRALLLQMLAWVKNGKTPPDSRYPSLERKTLVTKEKLGFPKIVGLETPTTLHRAYRADYGPNWQHGIISNQPPKLGYAFPAMVAQVDRFGNETGGVSNVEIRLPLATYTPWSLRLGMVGGSHELKDFQGYCIPLATTEAERLAKGDSRPSIASLYPNREYYLSKLKLEAVALSREGFLLPEDVDYVVERAGNMWDWIKGTRQVQLTTIGPEKGHLLIIGGGRLDPLFYEKFKELAGGPNAEIVVIPTAGEDEYLNKPEVLARIKKDYEGLGFNKVTILHTRDPKVADSPEFTAAIERAGGVWFTGGRQWRLADAYLNTRTHQAIRDLLDRGGIVAGSSAGATIQGSYLARGDTEGNTLMMGDHEEGMNFLTNVAIDQHLLVRNRQFDLFEILENHPGLLGIGLDENTGILVQGETMEVLGASYVAIYDGKKWSPERQADFPLSQKEEKFYLLKAGQKYDLRERTVINGE